jgi:uncharacterized membrane protein
MATITESIDVGVDVTTAYNQWTQFESFPKFMDGVEQIRQTDDKHLHWKTNVGGVSREFDAEITEQHPEERVAWQTQNGVHQAGVVTFHRIDDDTTRVTLQLNYDPKGLVEKAGDALGIVERRAKGDLANFKTYIERKGASEGAWRGDVPRDPQRGESGS